MTDLTLINIQKQRFSPSKRVEVHTKSLSEHLGLEDKASAARLGVGRSLSVPSMPPESPHGSFESGTAIKGDTLFGDDLALWVALIVEHAAAHGGHVVDTSEALTDLVKRHWERGVVALWEEWNAVKSLEGMVVRLAERASLPLERPLGGGSRLGSSHTRSGPIELRLGEIGVDVSTGAEMRWILNASGHSPHMGLFGKSGKGKTRTAKSVLRQIHEYGVPIILIDPKGEFRETEAKDFLLEIGANSVTIGRQPIPLDVFAASDGDDISVIDGFCGALKAALPQLGAKQLDVARTVLKRQLGSGPVSFAAVVEGFNSHYAKAGMKVDSLLATVRMLGERNLFEQGQNPATFFSRSWVLSVGNVTDEVLKFTLLFVLDSLLRHLRAQPETAVEAGSNVRPIGLCLAIDEARRVMDVANPSLIEGLVLECRSKGLACMFISQSPDHMDRASDDILKQLEVVASFEADVNANAMRRLFGEGARPADLQQLELGQMLARLPGLSGPVVVQGWSPSRGSPT